MVDPIVAGDSELSRPLMGTEKKSAWLRDGGPYDDALNAPHCDAKTRDGAPLPIPARISGRCCRHGQQHRTRDRGRLDPPPQGSYQHERYSAETRARWKETKTLMAPVHDLPIICRGARPPLS